LREGEVKLMRPQTKGEARWESLRVKVAPLQAGERSRMGVVSVASRAPLRGRSDSHLPPV